MKKFLVITGEVDGARQGVYDEEFVKDSCKRGVLRDYECVQVAELDIGESMNVLERETPMSIVRIL